MSIGFAHGLLNEEGILVDTPLLEPRAFVEGLAFPECPRWRDGSLWFADVWAHTVSRRDADGGTQVVLRLPDDRVAGLGFHPSGDLLFVSMRRNRVLRVTDAGPELFADLDGMGGDFLNDMITTPAGFSYVGVRADSPDARERLAVVGPTGTVSLAADDLEGPNGMVLAPDMVTLVVAETSGSRLTAFTVAGDGSLSDRRVFADVAPHTPDGIGIDAEGAIWMASPGTKRYLRVLDGGEVTDEIGAPGQGAIPLACALGGDDGRSLFMLGSAIGVDPAVGIPDPADVGLDASRDAVGAIHTVRVAVPAGGWQ